LSGPSLDLIAPIRPLQLCADGGYQLRLGVLGVPLIMVPNTSSISFARRSGSMISRKRVRDLEQFDERKKYIYIYIYYSVFKIL
jgi:hypothetical protein